MRYLGYCEASLFLLITLHIQSSTKIEEIALRKAARQGNQSHVVALVQKEVNINAADENGWTALHHASNSGYVEVAAFLLEHGAKVDGVEGSVQTPLSLALNQRDSEVARLLLKYKATIKSNISLYNAIKHKRDDLLELLIEHGINIHLVDEKGQTLLHAAVNADDRSILSLLIKHKIDVQAKDVFGRTAFDYAYIQKNEQLMRLLIEEGNFPIGVIRSIDEELYEAIQQSGVKVLNSWFDVTKRKARENKYQFNEKMVSEGLPVVDLCVWAGSTLFAGYVVYNLLMFIISKSTPSQALALQTTNRLSLVVALIKAGLEAGQNNIIESALRLGTLFEQYDFFTAFDQAALSFLQTFDREKQALQDIIKTSLISAGIADPQVISQAQEAQQHALAQVYYTLLTAIFVSLLKEHRIRLIVDSLTVTQGDTLVA